MVTQLLYIPYDCKGYEIKNGLHSLFFNEFKIILLLVDFVSTTNNSRCIESLKYP